MEHLKFKCPHCIVINEFWLMRWQWNEKMKRNEMVLVCNKCSVQFTESELIEYRKNQ